MGSFEDRKTTGCVFNIQKFSVHDGPGIRTLVFLKGCGMRCWWCSNPESHNFEPELAYNDRRCLGLSQCVRCVEACTRGAITRGEDDKVRIDRTRCECCPRHCAVACPAQSIITYGETKSVEDVLAVVEQDSMFYARSSGGMTLSGGEPLLQREFMLALLREAKHRRINTSMETCGLAPWENLRDACEYLDSIMFDIKSLDPAKHQEQTGAPIESVLANFTKMMESYPNLSVHVRTPVIPGFNDSVEAILPIAELVRRYPNADYEILPYHRLGTQKYLFLGKESPMGEKKLPEGLIEQIHVALRGEKQTLCAD